MNETRLKEKGWSGAEIAHARKVLGKMHPRKRRILRGVEISTLVLLFVLTAALLAGIGVTLAPLSQLSRPLLGYAIGVLFGFSAGGLTYNAVRTLHETHKQARLTLIALVLIGGISSGIGSAWFGGPGTVVGFLVGGGMLLVLLLPEKHV